MPGGREGWGKAGQAILIENRRDVHTELEEALDEVAGGRATWQESVGERRAAISMVRIARAKGGGGEWGGAKGGRARRALGLEVGYKRQK